MKLRRPNFSQYLRENALCSFSVVEVLIVIAVFGVLFQMIAVMMKFPRVSEQSDVWKVMQFVFSKLKFASVVRFEDESNFAEFELGGKKFTVGQHAKNGRIYVREYCGDKMVKDYFLTRSRANVFFKRSSLPHVVLVRVEIGKLKAGVAVFLPLEGR